MPAKKSIRQSLEDMSLPEPNSGCWLWIGYICKDGYGILRGRCAHRFAYEDYIGPIPDGLEIDHLCKTRSCVNPEHLEPVTHAENIARGDYKTPNHRNLRKTHCPKGHPFSGENLIIERKKDGGERRRCRECVKEMVRLRRQRDDDVMKRRRESERLRMRARRARLKAEIGA